MNHIQQPSPNLGDTVFSRLNLHPQPARSDARAKTSRRGTMLAAIGLALLANSVSAAPNNNQAPLCTPPMATMDGYTSKPSTVDFVAINKDGIIATSGGMRGYFERDTSRPIDSLFFHNPDMTANPDYYVTHDKDGNAWVKALPNGDFIYVDHVSGRGKNALYRVNSKGEHLRFGPPIRGYGLTAFYVSARWVYIPLRSNLSGRYELYRLDAETGKRDESFYYTYQNRGISNFTDILELPDGKVLIAQHKVGIIRLNKDGSIDHSFTTQGKGRIFTQQHDGKILVSGTASHNGKSWSGLFRMNPNGSIDDSFASIRLTLKGRTTSPHKIIVNNQGEIFASGNFDNFNGKASGQVIKLNADGTLNQEFTRNTYNTGHRFSDMALQSDGKIVGVGTDGLTSFDHRGIVRLHANGKPDVLINHNANNLAASCAHTATVKPYEGSTCAASGHNELLTMSNFGRIVKYDLATDEIILGEQGYISDYVETIDPLSKMFAVDSNGIIYTATSQRPTSIVTAYDPVTQSILWTYQNKGYIRDIAVSKDGSQVAFLNGYYTIEVLDGKTGKTVPHHPVTNDWVMDLQFSPDGEYLYYIEGRRGTLKRAIANQPGRFQPVINLPRAALHSLEFSWINETSFMVFRYISNYHVDTLFKYNFDPRTGTASLDPDFGTNGSTRLNTKVWGKPKSFDTDSLGNTYLIGQAAQGATGASKNITQNIVKVSADGKSINYDFIPYHNINDPNNGILIVNKNALCDTPITQKIDIDDDNDGIPDIFEQSLDPANPGNFIDIDTDNDGIVNRLDTDSDNDGCSDAFEAGATTLLTPNYTFPGGYGENGLDDSLEGNPENGVITYYLTYLKAIDHSPHCRYGGNLGLQ